MPPELASLWSVAEFRMRVLKIKPCVQDYDSNRLAGSLLLICGRGLLNNSDLVRKKGTFKGVFPEVKVKTDALVSKVVCTSERSAWQQKVSTECIPLNGHFQLIGINLRINEAGATSMMTIAANLASAVIAKTTIASRKIMQSSIRPTVL